MKLSDTVMISAPQDVVWAGLNDPDILKDCIPGCEKLEKINETEFEATAGVKVGPLTASFKGKVALSDLDPPNSYTITGEGIGGPAGFAKGTARVRLANSGNSTELFYEVNASVGGKLAQIGQRFIDQTAKKFSEEFFSCFAEQLAKQAPPTENLVSAEPAARRNEEPPKVRQTAPKLKSPDSVVQPNRLPPGPQRPVLTKHNLVLAGLLIGVALIAIGLISIIYG